MEEGESERPTLQLSGWSGFVWEREERKEEHTSSDGEHKDNQQEVHTQPTPEPPYVSSVSDILKEVTEAEEGC